MTRILNRILLVAALTEFTATGVCGAEFHSRVDSLSISNTYEFARWLMNDGDYFRAIGEFKRVLYLNPDDVLADSAAIYIGQALFAAGRYGEIGPWHRAYCVQRPKLLRRGDLLLARSYFRATKYSLAFDLLSSRVGACSGLPDCDEFRYYAGLAAVHLERYGEAFDMWRQIDDASRYYTKAQRYILRLTSINPPSRRSPLLSGVLSIIPGCGYAYNTYYRTALSAFIVNGLLFAAAYDASIDGDSGEALFFSMLFTSFYAGNIYGSARSAHRFNENQAARYQEYFKE
jgi:tetratricopeptide (TPR) repeat protein